MIIQPRWNYHEKHRFAFLQELFSTTEKSAFDRDNEYICDYRDNILPQVCAGGGGEKSLDCFAKVVVSSPIINCHARKKLLQQKGKKTSAVAFFFFTVSCRSKIARPLQFSRDQISLAARESDTCVCLPLPPLTPRPLPFRRNGDAAIAVRLIFPYPRHRENWTRALELHPCINLRWRDVKRDRDRIEFQSDGDLRGREKKGI